MLLSPCNASAQSMPEVRRAEDGFRAVEDPAAAAGALRVVGGVDDRDPGQQAAEDERQQHAVAPRARVAQVHHVPPRLSLHTAGRITGHMLRPSTCRHQPDARAR